MLWQPAQGERLQKARLLHVRVSNTPTQFLFDVSVGFFELILYKML